MSTELSVKTNDGTISLIRRHFLDEEISIRLPERLINPSEEEIKSKFISVNIPKEIKIDYDNKILFTLSDISLEESQAPGTLTDDEQVKQLLLAQQKIISRMTPGYQEYGMQSKKIDEHTVGTLNYKSNNPEEDIYNVLFLSVHNEKMIYALFSCPYEVRIEWNLIFIACLDTIKFSPKYQTVRL